MVRVFLKNLNITILSVCLLNITTSTAIAQVQVNRGQVQTDAHGKKTAEVEYKFDEIQQKSLLSTITMLAGGVFLSRALTVYKPMTKDIMAGAVGGASFLGGEILSNIQIKKELDAVSVKVQLDKDADHQGQLKTFENLKEGYLKVQKSLKMKKMLQLASAASFGTAGLLAVYMQFKSHSGMTACKAAITKGAALATLCANNPKTGVQCGKCAAELNAIGAVVSKYTMTKDIPSESLAKATALKPIQTNLSSVVSYCPANITTKPIATGVASACTPAFTNELGESSVGAAVPIVAEAVINHKIDKVFHAYFEKSLIAHITKLLFPHAQASWMPTIVGISGAVLALFFKTSKIIAATVDPLMVTPKNRAIVWGIFTAMAYSASKSTDEVMKAIDERIKAIDEIIADLSKHENGINAQAGTLASGETGFIKSIGGMNDIDSGKNYATTCLDSSATKNCSSISKKFDKALSSDYDLPDGLKSLTSQVGKFGDGLGGKSELSAGTLAAAEGLGAKNAAIQKALSDQMNKMKKLSPNEPGVDAGGLLAKLNNETNKVLKKGGMTPSNFLSAIGGTPNSVSDAAAKSQALLNDESHTNDLVAAINPAIDLGNGKAAGNFDFNFSDEGSSAMGLNESNYNKESFDFGLIPEESIGKADGPSLFEIVTSRYMKSGYPKLLEEDQKNNQEDN